MEGHTWTRPDGCVETVCQGRRSLVMGHAAPTGCWTGATPTRGRHEPGDRLIGLCLVIGMADRTTGITTSECPFITIQRAR